MEKSEILLGLSGYQITGTEWREKSIRIRARLMQAMACPHCGSARLRSKGWFLRLIRHETWGQRPCFLELEGRKWQCRDCERQFREQFPGILKCQRASEAFQRMIYQLHLGINRSRPGSREGIGAATVERYFQRGLQRQSSEWHSRRCPRILGIDEHFFTRKKGFATSLCDLGKHKMYDVVLGRSELSLESYFNRLEGKKEVLVVCMDLASNYRALVRKHFPNARIVADRFHVIRLINHHFLACWREIDPVGSKNRGLLSLMRRHRQNLSPEQWGRLCAYFETHQVLGEIYRFKQRLCNLLLIKHQTRKQCEKLAPRFLKSISQLREAKLPQLVTLAETLKSWSAEIATMWRFTKNNGITEGFHTKMELISRQAYGFRNFENYRMRVKVLCS